MKDILLGPIYSLFSLSFYRRILTVPLSKGFTYLIYLSVLFAIGVTFLFLVLLLTLGNQFVDWLAQNFPEMTLTRDGVVANVAQPFVLTHPDLGTILIVDTTKEMPNTEDLTKSFFFVTKTKLIVRNQPGGDYRVQELVPQSDQAKAAWKDFKVTGDLISRIYRRIRPFVTPILFIFCIAFFFVWKLLAALFYSLIALILNLFRKERLGYLSLLNLSFFAMSPLILLQWLKTFVPVIPLNWLVAIVVTGIYLAFAILKTQSPAQPKLSQPVPSS